MAYVATRTCALSGGIEGVRLSCVFRSKSNTLAKSPNLPVKFLEGVGLTSLITGDHLTIEFTSARYGQLTPIEYPLSATLGKHYIVEQSADRIVVKLESPEQFQAALDAVVPVLAALERAEPGEVERLSVSPKEGDKEVMEGEELRTQLAKLNNQVAYLSGRFDEEHPPDRVRLSAPEEALVEVVEKGVPGLLAYGLRKWFEHAGTLGEAANRAMLEIYGRFLAFFTSTRYIAELPAHEEEPPKQLPPASDKGT